MIITISSEKGGTGKTTLGVVIAETLIRHGKKVLFIDLDPNCSLSEVYGYALKENNSTAFYKSEIENIEPYHVKDIENNKGKGSLDIIPADIDLNLYGNVMDLTLRGRIKKLGYKDRYDYILIDPPGNWCSHTRNAIFASDKLVIAGTCSALDYRATTNYIDLLSNCDIEIDLTVLVNRYSERTNQDGIFELYKQNLGDYMYPQAVPDIRSLRRLTSDPSYELIPSIQARLNPIVTYITGVEL